MSGKPEGRGPPGLQNVLVYVSGESFYQGNGNPNPGPGPSSYPAPSAVKQQQQQQQQQQHQQQTQQELYNVQQAQNGYQYGVGYGNPVGAVRTVMGGDGIGGNVVFPRCSDAESSCGSVGASDRSDTSSGSGSVSVYKPPVSDSPASVAVPTGWKRLHTNGMVIYVSPSHTALSSLDQVKAYLQTQGTCKCGLECPLNCDIVFNFDPKVATRPWPSGVGDLAKLCNHKRKQLAMSSNLDHHLDLRNNDGVKKKKRKVTGNYSASVSQLLAQRERDRSKEAQQQGWTDGTGQVVRDGSPMTLHMQQQSSTRVYPPSYNSENHNQQQFYRYNPHSGGCPMPSQQAEMMGGGGESNYSSQGGAYTHQGMMMGNHQYQYQQREDHHCQQKPHNSQQHQQHQQQMMHQQQQHFQQQQQQHFQQSQPTHMMQSNSPRPQIQHNMQHQQILGQQVQAPHQHYERMMGPSPQFQQYHQPDHKMQMMQQHQHCIGKQMPREGYQRTDMPPQVQPGVVLQTSQGQMMLPQQAMVLQQQQNLGMQPSQNQPMMQVVQSPNPSMVQSPNASMVQSPNPAMVQSPNPSIIQSPNPSIMQSQNPAMQQTHQQNQIMMQQPQHPTPVQQGVQVQLPNQQMMMQNNQQQNLNQVQSNINSSMCSSPAMLMHHQRPAPPWQTNRNNQIANQNAVINQQPHNQQPHTQQQSHSQQPHNQQQHNQQQPPQSQPQQQQIMQPNMYERVPPLHHHLPNAPVWNEERKKAVSKMQGKPAAHLKNKRLSYLSDHHHNVGTNSEQPCPNVDVRHIPQEQNKLPNNQSQAFSNTNIPSFMEDPSGYLAQQTALLNSTISRQTGMNSNGINIVCQNNCNTQMNDQSSGQGQVVINLPTSSGSPVNNQGVPLPSTVMLPNQQKQNVLGRVNQATTNSIKIYRSNTVSSSGYQNQSQTNQTGLPDSSGVSPDRGRCSQGCGTNMIESFHSQNQNHQPSNTVTVKFHPEESPVTSSTFMENRHQMQAVSTPDSRGPIQGGTVSTSNRSPPEMVSRIPPDDPSPGRTSTPSSTQSRRLDASPEPSIFISTSSPFTLANGNTIIYQQQALSNSQNSRSEPSTPVAQSPKPQQQHQHHQHQQINVMLQDVQMTRLPTIVTTMASGHTVSSNTITSVLAGRANTATVTVNNQTTVLPPATVVTNQQVPQVSVSKTPLEMVQSVVSSIQVPASSAEAVLKPATAPSLPTGHIIMSSNGQLIVTNSQGQPAILSPQQNIGKITTSMAPMTGVSTIVTSVTGAVTQVIPSVGITQQVLGQPTVLVNTLPAPLLFQPGVINVDGTMNTVQIPHLAVATGNVLPGQMVDESRVGNNSNGAFSPRNQPALLSPEGSNSKRKANAKKRKVSPQTVASMLHIAAQQNSPTAGATGMVVQQQQPQQNFSPPMLQALTILPSKTGHFGGTQQLIATGNILQPLNLVQNFPTIQQFLVPAAGLGGVVMATGDGTATLLQDTVQLNVLTPMQGPGGTVFGHTGGQSILAAGPAGMVIRAPANSNQQANKVQLHSQNSAGNQFIANSPNQFLINSPAFSGQLSPMLANVSPANQQLHSFNNSGGSTQARSNQTQEFIQCGQTLMVPCTIAQNPPPQNTTVVQQNTTIVQQQTTMVSNNQQNIEQNPGPSTSSSSSLSLNQHNFILNNSDGKQQNFILTTDQKGQGGFILSPNPDKPGTHIILNTDKTQYGGLIISQEKPNQMCGNFILSNSNVQQAEKTSNNFILSSGTLSEKQNTNRFTKHSVSTQTAANQQVLQVSSTPVPTALVVATSNTFCQTSTAPSSYTGSPPDTTTHSPVDGGTSQSPGLAAEAPSSSVAVGSTDDLSSPTSSSDPGRAQPMVHCVSSSNEQDTPEWKENSSTSPALFSPPPHNIEITYNRGMGNIKNISMSSFVESSSISMQTYESERHLKRSSDGEMGRQIYNYSSLSRSHKPKRHCADSEARILTSTLSSHDEDDEEAEAEEADSEEAEADGGSGGCPGAGDLVWGAARGFPSWPGKLVGPAPTPGRVWVRWFGGPGTLSEVHPASLKTLSEGLEAHHRERKNYRKSRKLNSQLENAIQEAMAELDRMSETPQQGAPLPPSPLQVSARKR